MRGRYSLLFKPSALWAEMLLLGKIKLSTSVVFSSAAAYFIAFDTFDAYLFAKLLVGGILLVMASNAFNQIMERNRDALMNRTKNRPLPSGRMTLHEAYVLAIVWLVLGMTALLAINNLTALFGALSVFLYTLVYTPLKARTPLAVFVGAFPGAIPYMLGWVAVTNDFDIETGTLFLQQFLWQFPHFWAIAWFSFEDYGRAGYYLLPGKKKSTNAKWNVIIYSVWMTFAGILPVTGITGRLELSVVGAVLVGLLGVMVIWRAFGLRKKGNDKSARQLMFASLIYLTGMQLIYVIDRFI